jgi:hypothetical protein
VTALVERALAPLDGARGIVLRTAVGVPSLRRLLATRTRRVPLLLSVHAAAAFTLAVLIPALPLALAPILLGVPHLLSDVRHLVARRGLPAWWVRTIAAFAAAMLTLRVLQEAHLWRASPLLLEHAVGGTWLVCAALVGAALGRARHRTVPVLIVAVLIAGAALAAPRAFRLAFVHGHNLVALAIWVLLFRRTLSRAWPVVVLAVVGAAVLASGILLPVTIHHGVLSVLRLHLFAAADWIAPGLPDRWALGLTTAFAFLQSVHYAIWLVAIPQDDARVGATATFRMTWRALVRDLGGRGLALGVAMAVVELVGGILSLARTRVLFLSLASFHAWMELALLAFFVARDGLWARPGRPAAAPAPVASAGNTMATA